MTTIRVYRVLVYEGDAAAIQENLDRRHVKDIRVSTDYTIQEAVLGNIILPEPVTSIVSVVLPASRKPSLQEWLDNEQERLKTLHDGRAAAERGHVLDALQQYLDTP